ncbi:hypothetical protein FGG08_000017 [Glutinoglossum americanum]|uniref:Uncharacterized protein n=1 Tax=Glutinoglossum americanum TaxID=1670608 RepID=A0A9P8I4J1_9PEZI|nr:hypothetical protein FGG08_000017 [Glutinoglossum americanum]
MNRDGANTWVLKLKMSRGSDLDNIPLCWTGKMLRKESAGRPTARSLFDLIVNSKTARDRHFAFSGLCCQPNGDQYAEQSSSSDVIAKSRHHPTHTGTSTTGGVPLIDHKNPPYIQSPDGSLDPRQYARRVPATPASPPAPLRASLFAAMRDSDAGRLRAVIQDGVDTQPEDVFGERPLYKVMSSGKEEIARVLLGGGTEVNAQNRRGYMALHMAAFKRNGDLVRLLLEEGADATVRASDGWTALHMAASEKSIEVLGSTRGGGVVL